MAKIKSNVADGWYMAKVSDVIHFMKNNRWLCQPWVKPNYIYYRYNQSELEGEQVCKRCLKRKSKQE